MGRGMREEEIELASLERSEGEVMMKLASIILFGWSSWEVKEVLQTSKIYRGRDQHIPTSRLSMTQRVGPKQRSDHHDVGAKEFVSRDWGVSAEAVNCSPVSCAW